MECIALSKDENKRKYQNCFDNLSIDEFGSH